MAVPPFQVKALYDYNSQEEDDLRFKYNQVITVTEEEDADWYYGEYEDGTGSKQEGLFPKNFVKIVEPETPPRPQRVSRSKKENEPSTSNKDQEAGNVGFKSVPPSYEDGSTSIQAETDNTELLQSKGTESTSPAQPQEHFEDSISAAQDVPKVSKLPSSTTSKPAPPVVNEKPSSNAFRDRINAFNKPTAPPVAPGKPGGPGGSTGSSFVKKPFVAPPPSRNAYIPPPREPPPQKLYGREDRESSSQTGDASNITSHTQPPNAPFVEIEQDQPKPTSLKDRIALLQKQQMEQAARHAEAGQRKEKAKRPKKTLESEEASIEEENSEGEVLEKVGSSETAGKRSMESQRGHRKSHDETPTGSPTTVPSRDVLSDGNDADQSGAADTEDGEESSTGRDDSEGKTERKPSFSGPRTFKHPAVSPNIKGATESPTEYDNGEDGEEDEVDPEMRRRIEIRERMAKMSGGMGMAGMFGPPSGLPPKASTKKNSISNERKDSANSAHVIDSPPVRAAPFPVIPMPSLQKVSSPEEGAQQTEVGKEQEEDSKSVTHGRRPEEIPDVEDIEEDFFAPTRRSTERPAAPPVSQERLAPLPPNFSLSERPVPPPPVASRPVPPPPRHIMSPSEGSESDDELSSHEQKRTEPDSSRQTSKDDPRPLTQSGDIPQGSHRPANELPQRSSRVPPIPGAGPTLSSPPQNRAPPPPPPPAPPVEPPTRSSTDSRKPPQASFPHQQDESDEEVTEYDGDYDTDIASGAAHKDALKAHARAPSLEDENISEEASLHHSGLPSIGPPQSSAPRVVPPPPPPQQLTQTKRQSADMPRGAPPPPPPPRHEQDDRSIDYDPYNYNAPVRGLSSSRREDFQLPRTPTIEEPEPSYSTSSPQHARVPSLNQLPSQYPPSPDMSALGNSNPRLSSDMQRASTAGRRSMDVTRSSGEHYMASDVDLGPNSHWWAQTGAPPPVFQNRREILFEVEESSTTRRGGKRSMTKDVYVLYMDYSQTIVTAHFEAADPSNATLLEQRHEQPPRPLRQDQLEEAHVNFGARIADAAKSREGSTVEDGTPHSLPLELISSLPDALRPVGVRAYGALVYGNLANASVQQYDEIRPGDIITFRNAKFGGHRGAVKSKYSIEVGKPDHVGVVVDWDGTKKKVRAWEQGRESKKVKIESFKFGDMKSGEVKVWRVMSRGWVGWEGSN